MIWALVMIKVSEEVVSVRKEEVGVVAIGITSFGGVGCVFLIALDRQKGLMSHSYNLQESCDLWI